MTTVSRDQICQVRRAVEASTCVAYISEGHRCGWVATNIGELNPQFSRSQSHIDIDIDTLFRSVRCSSPAGLDGMEIASLVRQRTACMRYAEGEFFGAHVDSPFVSEDGRFATKLSLVLYLNDDYSGGETLFPDLELEVAPEVGKILLFPPLLRHLSKPILRGQKYIIRSEVLCRIPAGGGGHA